MEISDLVLESYSSPGMTSSKPKSLRSQSMIRLAAMLLLLLYQEQAGPVHYTAVMGSDRRMTSFSGFWI